MLRNSTQQFRQRYQNNQPHPYTAHGILALRLTPRRHPRPQQHHTSPRISPSPHPPSRKLEHSLSTGARTQQIRTKQKGQEHNTMRLQEGKGAHRRQLTAPFLAKQEGLQSETSITSFKWEQKPADSSVSRDPKEFLSSLAKNSVFFCCKCFQYVFEIEKQRHFPDCKDALDLSEKQSAAFREKAWGRLERMAELARYSGVKTWEVEQLYKEIRSNQFGKIYGVGYASKCSFFSLDEIITAFVYTYQTLLKGALFPSAAFGCF